MLEAIEHFCSSLIYAIHLQKHSSLFSNTSVFNENVALYVSHDAIAMSLLSRSKVSYNETVLDKINFNPKVRRIYTDLLNQRPSKTIDELSQYHQYVTEFLRKLRYFLTRKFVALHTETEKMKFDLKFNQIIYSTLIMILLIYGLIMVCLVHNASNAIMVSIFYE